MRDFLKALVIAIGMLSAVVILALICVYLSESEVGYWTMYGIGCIFIALLVLGSALL